MSQQTDLFKLLTLFQDIEQFDMWDSAKHLVLAYIIDRNYNKADYTQKYEKWVKLAEEKDFNELAWLLSQENYENAKEDSRISSNCLKTLEKFHNINKNFYDKGELVSFGYTNENCIPIWFGEFFNSYMMAEGMRRESDIKKHMLNEYRMNEKRAQEDYEKLIKHYDIWNDFCFYIRNNRLKLFHPATSEGFTAQQLCDAGLSPLEAYNYLIYLRESPEEALANLKKKTSKKKSFSETD